MLEESQGGYTPDMTMAIDRCSNASALLPVYAMAGACSAQLNRQPC